MQTQHFNTSLHQDLYHTPQGMHSAMADPYISAGGGTSLLDSFSRGSLSYPHPDYRYIPDRGNSAGLCSTSRPVDSVNMGFPGSTLVGGDAFRPEEISDYQSWHWGGSTPQRPHIPQPSTDFQAYKATYPASGVRIPSAKRPTPAAMAVLLNPNNRSDIEPPASNYDPAHTSQLLGTRPILPVDSTARAPSAPDSQSREKKHACTMCHKRFDRPSTLRKHLLVHTGEKAFVCDICGRRFGVASNLNRHYRRCILKPVNTTSSSSNKSVSESPPATVPSPECAESPYQPRLADNQASVRGRVVSPVASSSAPGTSDNVPSVTGGEAQDNPKPTPQKRRRRAPSPSRWIPHSLLPFNLMSEEFYKSVPVPLTPVRRSLHRGEERDSWEENVGAAPYHPDGWKGVLPGPGLGIGLGLGGKDVRNLNLGGSGGFVLGRVLAF